MTAMRNIVSSSTVLIDMIIVRIHFFFLSSYMCGISLF